MIIIIIIISNVSTIEMSTRNVGKTGPFDHNGSIYPLSDISHPWSSKVLGAQRWLMQCDCSMLKDDYFSGCEKTSDGKKEGEINQLWTCLFVPVAVSR